MKHALIRSAAAAACAMVPLVLASCGSEPAKGGPQGTILMDGSSTVAPLMTLAGDDFHNENSGVDVTVLTSGTGGGFERLCAGEIDIATASRPIDDSEAAACGAAGVEYERLVVANDALSIVVHPDNNWATCLTVAQLRTIWEPAADGTITNWNQVDPAFPDEPLDLYGPGTESGTYDYFNTVINGDATASRTDFNATEDDFVSVAGVSSNVGSLGYFGFSYLEANLDKLKAVAVDDGAGCVEPSAANVAAGTYTPLSRPLYIYVKTTAAQRPEVRAFLEYYADNQDALTYDAIFVPLSDDQKTSEQSNELTALLS